MKKMEGNLFLLLVVAASLSLSGCSNPVLDYRNMQVVNGKIYSGDANKPFTGKLTNLPEADILKTHPGFRKVADPLLRSDINLVYYGTDAGYIALLAQSNGFCEVPVVDGVLDGKADCKSAGSDEEGTTITLRQGVLDGKFRYFNPSYSKTPMTEVSFLDGTPDGEQKVYGLKTGKLTYQVHWKNGALNGEAATYALDGERKTTVENYTNGVEEGAIDVYDARTGTHIAHGEMVHGKLQGKGTTWDTKGNVVKERMFVDGAEVKAPEEAAAVAPATIDVQACVTGWTAAYHKEQGSDTMITTDQLDEWKQWCQQGKQVLAN